MADDIDMVNRDPNTLNSHIKVTFDEVIGEPDSAHTIDCNWRLAFKCFNLWKDICYKLLTILCGLPVAMCWGCQFGCLAFDHIWCSTPWLRYLATECTLMRKFQEIILGCCLEPCCLSCGKIFDSFR